MECPECGSKTKVLDSRKYAGAVYRKRECKLYNFTFWTEEIEIDSNSKVIKDMYACYKMHTRDKKLKRDMTSQNPF